MRASEHQVSAGGNKFTAMHDGMDADDKSIGGESNRIFHEELQKELDKLRHKGSNMDVSF